MKSSQSILLLLYICVISHTQKHDSQLDEIYKIHILKHFILFISGAKTCQIFY